MELPPSHPFCNLVYLSIHSWKYLLFFQVFQLMPATVNFCNLQLKNPNCSNKFIQNFTDINEWGKKKTLEREKRKSLVERNVNVCMIAAILILLNGSYYERKKFPFSWRNCMSKFKKIISDIFVKS